MSYLELRGKIGARTHGHDESHYLAIHYFNNSFSSRLHSCRKGKLKRTPLGMVYWGTFTCSGLDYLCFVCSFAMMPLDFDLYITDRRLTRLDVDER